MVFWVFVRFWNSTKFASDIDRSGKWPREQIGKFIFLFNTKRSGHGCVRLLFSCRPVFIH